jgi:hypothetical protein
MDSPEAIQSVNGTCTIRRWTGLEVMHYSMFEVPAIVRAYNLFMNAVDRIDQIRSSCPTRRREKRVSMTFVSKKNIKCALDAYNVKRHSTRNASQHFTFEMR